MEDLVFFKNATRKICGGLDPSIILKNCYYYLREFMPLDALSMGVFEPDNGVLRTIRFFSKENGISQDFWDKPINITSQAMELIGKYPTGKSYLYNDARKTPPGRDLCKIIGFDELSYIAMNLNADLSHSISRSGIGVIGAFAMGLNRFTEEQARLLEMLHDPIAITLSNTVQHQELIRLKDILKDDNRFLHDELHRVSEQKIVGDETGLKEVAKMIRIVAPLNNTVLLLGETGVGKEVIANALHFYSPRASGPFIKVNCGAIPENLIDSELFGHTKGAFTGAVSDKRGRFERAHKGTIFLDEIGELPLSAQVRLLRFLQFKELERVGGSESIKVNVRIIAATHKDIKQMIQAGKFREDLWYRISVFPINIPPLRQRRDDIPDLVNYFIKNKVQEFNLKYLPSVSPKIMENLQSYDWPGNVRELENAVEREVIRSMAGNQNRSLPFEEFATYYSNKIYPHIESTSHHTMSYDECTRQHILQVLEKTKGKIQGKDGAAAILHLNSSTLRNRMIKLGIPFGKKSRTLT